MSSATERKNSTTEILSWFQEARLIPLPYSCALQTTNIQTASRMAPIWLAGIIWATRIPWLMALSKCPNPTVFQKTLSVNDFYFGSPDWNFPMGHVSFVGKLDGDTLKAGAPKIAPKWTLDLMAKHSLDFWLTSEDPPDPNNRVTINRDGDIVLQYKANNEEGHKRLIKKLESLMQQQTKCSIHGHECHEGLFARNLYLGQRIQLAGVAHQNGTIRFGDDPKTSALDRNCKAHEVDNLYVVDGSFFCSSGAVNPALTIIANALRVGDHLLERMGARRAEPEMMATA